MDRKENLVEMQNITKDFPGVRALDNVDFELRTGEVHVLVGENGAGKSTLVKILSGVHPVSNGTIMINSLHTEINSSNHAQNLGIGIVFQETNLSPHLTVAQNIFLCHEIFKFGWIVDIKEEIEKAGKFLNNLSIDIDPTELVENLSLGQQQLIAFARVLSFNPKIIILDEPTSSLSAKESELMFELIRKLKHQDIGIIYITHRLDEIWEIGDRITVLRDGKKINTVDVSKTDKKKIIKMMVGRDISEMYPKEQTEIGKEAFRIEGLGKKGLCSNVNLSVYDGEVVGLFGLVGSGRTEIMRLAFGLDNLDSGEIFIREEKVKNLKPSKLVDLGVGFLPEDRKKEGLCLALSLKENIIRASLNRLFPQGIVSRKKEKEISYKFIKNLQIASPSDERLVVYLSGGTQQKIVIAQWLCAESTILILDEPTRGIDVGTKVEIYKIINNMAKNGSAIFLISSELPEIMGIADRIYVFRKGKVTGEYTRNQFSAEDIASAAFEGKEKNNGKK